MTRCWLLLLAGLALATSLLAPQKGRVGRIAFRPHLVVDSDAKFIHDDDNVWQIRRKITREVLLPFLEKTSQRLTKLDEAEESTRGSELITSQTKEERSIARKEKREREAKAGVAVSAFFVAIGAAVLRLGGRGALLNVLGLDFANNAEIRDQVDSFITIFQQNSELSIPLYFLGWLVAKTFCLDFIGVSLALSSGLLFGGILQGTLAAVAGSSLASLLVFSASRYWLRDEILAEISSRPLLRAVDRAVAKDGFKTCFVLRLSPILPIPIGAYNYLFGVTGIKAFEFYAAIALASFKPYFLDSYLGVFGKTMIDAKGDQGDAQDTLLLLVVGAIIAVGTLATQVAGNLYDEIKSEARTLTSPEPQLLSSAPPSASRTGGLISKIFRLASDPTAGRPDWLLKIQSEVSDASSRVDSMVKDELVSSAIERSKGIAWAWTGEMTSANVTRLALPLNLQPIKLEKEVNSEAALALVPVNRYRFPGVRSMADYERNGLGDDVTLQALYESTVFSFVLFGWVAALLDDDNFVEELE